MTHMTHVDFYDQLAPVWVPPQYNDRVPGGYSWTSTTTVRRKRSFGLGSWEQAMDFATGELRLVALGRPRVFKQSHDWRWYVEWFDFRDQSFQ